MKYFYLGFYKDFDMAWEYGAYETDTDYDAIEKAVSPTFSERGSLEIALIHSLSEDRQAVNRICDSVNLLTHSDTVVLTWDMPKPYVRQSMVESDLPKRFISCIYTYAYFSGKAYSSDGKIVKKTFFTVGESKLECDIRALYHVARGLTAMFDGKGIMESQNGLKDAPTVDDIGLVRALEWHKEALYDFIWEHDYMNDTVHPLVLYNVTGEYDLIDTTMSHHVSMGVSASTFNLAAYYKL